MAWDGEWPLSTEQEELSQHEVGARAWSWAQDCNPFELNDQDAVNDFVPGYRSSLMVIGWRR